MGCCFLEVNGLQTGQDQLVIGRFRFGGGGGRFKRRPKASQRRSKGVPKAPRAALDAPRDASAGARTAARAPATARGDVVVAVAGAASSVVWDLFGLWVVVFSK